MVISLADINNQSFSSSFSIVTPANVMENFKQTVMRWINSLLLLLKEQIHYRALPGRQV